MNAKRWIALVIALGIFGVSLIASLTIAFFENFSGNTDITSLNDESQEVTLEDGNLSSKIAVLEVSGTIQDNGDSSSLLGSDGYNHRTFLKNLEQAKEDKTVKGIVLKVNSPGGGVYESAEIHKKLEEIKKETKKPIYVSMGSMAASGGIISQRTQIRFTHHRKRLPVLSELLWKVLTIRSWPMSSASNLKRLKAVLTRTSCLPLVT